ncbi:retrovirus-related pol polyprotein from transposon TNT 1-94 [Tanacetum coccineum]
MVKPTWNNTQRVNHQNFAKKTHRCAKRNMVPRAVLMKSGLVSVNIARQVNVAHLKTTVNAARPMSYFPNTSHSTIKRPINKKIAIKNSIINQRVNTVRGKNDNTTRPKVVFNEVKGNFVNAVKASACWDKGVIDSGCSRHIIGNMSYLIDYKEIDGGYVTFRGNPKGEKITGKGLYCASQNHFLVVGTLLIIPVSLISPRQVFEQVFTSESERAIGAISSFIARTPQQNGVAERRNMTLIEAARTMLADSKLPTTFWAEAVNTACYVQNRVPFGCPVTILNTIDHLGKFDGKANEGFFVGYSLNSKAFRVFNSRTRIVEENLHIRFSENLPNVIGTQSNGFACTKASDNADKARKEIEPSSHDDGFKLSSDEGKKVDEDLRKENECNDQEKEDNVNSTNNVNFAGTNKVNVVGKNVSNELPFDTDMPTLEDISTFNFLNEDEDDGVEADMNNLDTAIQVSPIPTTRIHKDHPLDQVIGDVQSAIQTRKMSKNLEKNPIRKIEEEVYVCQPLGFEDPDFPDRVYKMSYMGELTFFLGLQVKQKKDGIFISHDKYVAEILKKFKFTEVKTASTPMETQKPLLKDEDGEEVDVHMYRSMIGSLMYLTSSRPDIMFAVYSPFDLVAYTDSDYAGASLDRKSTTGGCQFLGCRLISWQCKKQIMVANSTTKVEYVGASSCCG